MSILTCDLCDADAGGDPYHATINGNGHTHICAYCFDPQQHDVGVLREKLNAAIKDAERWRLTFVNLQNSLDSALKSSLKLLDQIQVLEMRLAVYSKIISDRSHAGGAVMSQWIKCSDRLPDHRQTVITCAKAEPFLPRVARFYDDNFPHFEYEVTPEWACDTTYEIYWMPLPQPPEDQE